MVTIKEISREANVSIATVSKVLNGDYSRVSVQTKEMILGIAKRMNYTPNLLARGLTGNRSKIVGLIIPDISNPYFADVADGVASSGEEFGYQVMLCNTKDQLKKEKEFINTLAGYAINGVILASRHESIELLVDLLDSFRIPYVLIDNYNKERPYCVYTDDFIGSYTTTQYLIENGHKCIAFIGGETPANGTYPRYEGYLEALKINQFLPDEQLIHFGTYTVEFGESCTEEILLLKSPFTAIVCGNDLIAVGAMRAISRSGLKIPQDISIVGYDDTYLSTIVEPNLTTVKQPAYLIGGEAMRMLEKRINKEEPDPLTRSFSPSLIVRNSVQRPV